MQNTQSKTLNMEMLLNNMPDYWNYAAKELLSPKVSINIDNIRYICIIGMGGSAISGSLMQGYTYNSCTIPIYVCRHYDIPRWINNHTLVIASSYSGTTTETISCLNQAQKKGASCIAISATNNNHLFSKKNIYNIQLPILEQAIPPRCALIFNFFALYGLFRTWKLIPNEKNSIEETYRLLSDKQKIYAKKTSHNIAYQLAKKMHQTIPIFYSDSTMLHGIQLRWCNQLQENAKMLTWGGLLPEVNHNELEALCASSPIQNTLSLIMLLDKDDHKLTSKNMKLIHDLIPQKYHDRVTILYNEGNSQLTRMFYFIQLADWVSYYLATLQNIDPISIFHIEHLKKELHQKS